MNECAEKNRNRKPNGRRYDKDLMSFCSFIALKGGRSNYQIMKKNNVDGMPSIHGVNHAIKKNKSPIIEGELRHRELLVYLESLKLPLVVSLSEDATNITGGVEYSSSTNQIVGLVQPLNDENAMPIPLSYAATSATAIDNMLTNNKIPVAKVYNVIMAQPLAMKVPAFCLLAYGGDNKFTRTKIVEELATIGIKVVTFSSDSDTRYNSAMREVMLSCKTDESSEFPDWFQFDCTIALYIPVQDTVHIGTKMRNTFLNHIMMFGQHEISVDHIRSLNHT